MLLKKLAFAPLFLLFFSLTNYYLQPILSSTNLIFSLNSQIFIQLLILTTLLLLSSLFFIILVSLAQDWKVILPNLILASLLPLVFIPSPTGLILIVGFLISFLVTTTLFFNKLRSYLTFSPTVLLTPSVKLLTTYLVLALSFAYFLSANLEISKNGFEIPDSLIEASLKIASPQSSNPEVKGIKLIAQNPTLTPEQIELLKQNPDLLKQQGIDPATPTNKSTSPASSNPSPDLIKKLVKDQLQSVLKPYLSWIAPILALLFYFTLSFILSILSLLISPILWIIFYLLEKTGFIKFEMEMREVKKMTI